MSEMDAYKNIFLSESAEFIQIITDALLALESNPDDSVPVEEVFRGAHSLKGMAGAMGYERTADLTHNMESLMARVRQQERQVDQVLIDLMLEAVDMVGELIADESSGGSAVDASSLAARILEMAEDCLQKAAPDATAPTKKQSSEQTENRFSIKVELEESCALKAVRAYMVIKRLAHMGEVIETIPPGAEIEDEKFEKEFTVVLDTADSAEEVHTAAIAVSEVAVVSVEQLELKPPVVQDDQVRTPAKDPRARTAIPKLSETQTVRIAIGHLDTMVDLVGETVILRLRLKRIARELGSRELKETVEELNGIARDLQREVMHVRMVPTGNIFNRFSRMVRDLARDLDKQVTFEMEGLDIELDRTVLDEIGDPIVHLLRNSIDHGIEPAKERIEIGKPEKGTIRLEATRERDHVRIAVSDDGRGIDRERVWEKARELGLVEDNARDSYSDEEILNLTCIQGFSAAKVVTKVSGRGVGMDVVKGKIEHLGGTLTILSNFGKGTEFVLMLPLTLAIIQALIVTSSEDVYAVPLSAVGEVLSLKDVSLDTVDGAPVFIAREGLVIPVYQLDALLLGKFEGQYPASEDGYIVILQSGRQTCGLIVEGLFGRHEIVIKPLSKMFRNVKGLSGATVLGDGRVALILDPRTVFPDREEMT